MAAVIFLRYTFYFIEPAQQRRFPRFILFPWAGRIWVYMFMGVSLFKYIQCAAPLNFPQAEDRLSNVYAFTVARAASGEMGEKTLLIIAHRDGVYSTNIIFLIKKRPHCSFICCCENNFVLLNPVVEEIIASFQVDNT